MPLLTSKIDVSGWLHPTEQETLKELARTDEGPILELGSWVGLSTLTIIEGIKESGIKKEFVTVDLFPTEKNFIERDGKYWFETNGLQLSDCLPTIYKKEIQPILKRGVRKDLEANLQKYNAFDYVKIIEGNFHFLDIPMQHFSMIFADCCHNIQEFSHNFPRILQFGTSTCIYAIHDMVYDVPEITILAQIGSLRIFIK